MGIAGPLLAGREARRGTEAASRAQREMSAEAIAEQRRQFDISRADQLPWLQSGTRALGELDRLAGGDFSSFYNSPDYNFRRSEGMRDIGSSFAARGGAFGGNALRALTEFNQNMARGEFGDFYNRLASRAGVGQTAAGNLGALGANSAGNIGSILTNTGTTIGNNMIAGANARASGINQASQGASNAFGYFMGNNWGRRPAYTGGTGMGLGYGE